MSRSTTYLDADIHRAPAGRQVGPLDMVLEHVWRNGLGRRMIERWADRLQHRVESMRVLGGATSTPRGATDLTESALLHHWRLGSRVLHGPFRGMTYPSMESAGSSLVPKLLGCYEFELHQVLEHLFRHPLSSIVDVGCAEGYYAVGCALRCTRAKVFAFDTDPRARSLCAEMASRNEVAERIHIAGECTPELLRTLPLGPCSLVIVDCEGYESHLFDDAAILAMRDHFLLVECHDFIKPGVTDWLESRFSSTHRVLRIASASDLERAQIIGIPELAGMSTAERIAAVAERRPCRMNWLFMTPGLR
jgi:hypothetical protein